MRNLEFMKYNGKKIKNRFIYKGLFHLSKQSISPH